MVLQVNRLMTFAMGRDIMFEMSLMVVSECLWVSDRIPLTHEYFGVYFLLKIYTLICTHTCTHIPTCTHTHIHTCILLSHNQYNYPK